MKQLLLFSTILSSLILFSACESDRFMFKTEEEKLAGDWQVEKVKYKKNGALTSQDVTADYNGLFMSIVADSMDVINYHDQENILGSWSLAVEMIEEHCPIADETTEVIQLFLNYSPTSKEYSLDETWSIRTISKKKLKYNLEKDDGTYAFVLNRM